jgi:putative transposase
MRIVFLTLRQHVREVLGRVGRACGRVVREALAPAPGDAGGPGRGLLADLARSKRELLAENAFLRQQLLVAARQVRKPGFRVWDRLILVILAAVLAKWRSALILVKPETLLRWHRDVFRRLWRWRSRRKVRAKRRLSTEMVSLIRRMATQNRLWGAERIRGELLKLGCSVAKSTIQRYIRRIRSTPPEGQRWSTFLRNQAAGIWSCDLFEVRDLWFRCHFVFVVMHLASRRMLLAATTVAPRADWLAQQLRQLTPFGQGPKFLLRDNDAKFGTVFDDVAKGAGVRVIRTPVMAPKANAHCERLIGSVRRECLDHLLVFGEGHLQHVLDQDRDYYNTCRPHQGIGSTAPTHSIARLALPEPVVPHGAISRPVLGGLHHDYRSAA